MSRCLTKNKISSIVFEVPNSTGLKQPFWKNGPGTPAPKPQVEGQALGVPGPKGRDSTLKSR
jgi:hypothetical protein